MPELEELYSEIKDKLFSYIMKLSGDKHVAEEIVQETFCRALEQILISKKELNIAWFYTVSKHLYFDYVKKQNKYKFTEEIEKEDVSYEAIPYSNLLKNEDSDEVRKVLNMLKANYREILILREFKELSYEAISKLTGMSLVQVKVTLYRARNKFKKLYEGNHKNFRNGGTL